MRTERENILRFELLNNQADATKLQKAVIAEALNSPLVEKFFNDVIYEGCPIGVVPDLLNTNLSHQFYDTHQTEIEAYIAELERNFGIPYNRKGDLKQRAAWFGFEECAYRMWRRLYKKM